MSWWQRSAPVDPRRWVVLDVESSGLDAGRDRLLAVAAVALGVGSGAPRILVGDSFEVVLQHTAALPDKANILVHGIGVAEQARGAPAAQALAAFEQWVGRSPLVAFHSAFDEQLLRRAMQAALGRRLAGPWLDLAQLAPAVLPGVAGRSLDDWLDHCGIVCTQRHQAAADTLATAELLLRLWPAVQAQRAGLGFAALQRIAADARWLPR